MRFPGVHCEKDIATDASPTLCPGLFESRGQTSIIQITIDLQRHWGWSVHDAAHSFEPFQTLYNLFHSAGIPMGETSDHPLPSTHPSASPASPLVKRFCQTSRFEGRWYHKVCWETKLKSWASKPETPSRPGAERPRERDHGEKQDRGGEQAARWSENRPRVAKSVLAHEREAQRVAGSVCHENIRD